MNVQETTVPPTVAEPAPERALLEDLREYARQHRDLAVRNYRHFTETYGDPGDRLREMRDRLRTVVTRAKAEATEGYRKLERDIEAKTIDEPKRKVSSNGSAH